jgi:hypothetical protein
LDWSKAKESQLVFDLNSQGEKEEGEGGVTAKKNTVKPVLKGNLKGPEHFSAEARFLFNQGIL